MGKKIQKEYFLEIFFRNKHEKIWKTFSFKIYYAKQKNLRNCEIDEKGNCLIRLPRE